MLKDSYYIEPTDLDRLIFEKLVPPDHYLRQVKAVVEFESLRAEVKDCYSPDLGRGAEDPVRLIKLEYLQFHYGLSDREVIAEASVNIAYRYFLDLSLDSRLPVPSLLSQFRTRLGEERHQAVFDRIVAQARAAGLVKDRLRLKDATHVIANIAIPSTLQLVAQTRERLLESARAYDPQRVSEEEARARVIRQTTADLKDEERLVHRVTHLRAIVVWADALSAQLGPVSPVTPDPVRERFETARALAHQVLADRADPDGPDQVRSVVDPEARRGKHGDFYTGYLLDMSMDADSELITAVELLPANGDEGADAETLIRQEETAHGNDVAALSMDGAGYRGEILRRVQDPTGLGLTLYVPPSAPSYPEGYFIPADFTLNEAGDTLTCPTGQQTQVRGRNRKDTGWRFTFRQRDCAACPLLARCTPKLAAKHGRTVTKNDYQAEYDAAQARARTPDYQAVRREHPKVERKLAELVRQHGGRRARYWGRARVKIQALLTALVVNVKRMVKLLLGDAPVSPRQQPAVA